MSLYEKIVAGEEKISLVGLGYVGMPIAVAFARKVKVVGFDLNAAKIDLYKNGIDPTNEVGNDVIKNTTVEFTADPTKLKEAKFHIVAVPTPVNDDHTPDLTPVEGASRLLGQNLTDKKKVENRGLLSWAKYQRKRIKAGTLDEEKTRLFLELMNSRSKEHTGGRVRKSDV